MKFSNLQSATSLERERRTHHENIERLSHAKFGEGTISADHFQTRLCRAFRDDAMAERIREAIRAELIRRRELVDEKLRALGVEIDTEGGAA